MQRCNCTLRLSGDVGNTVSKKGISVAEIAVLRAIHGDDAVVDIQPITNDKTPHKQERARLMEIYGGHVIKDKSVMELLFPGEFAQLPNTLSDIGLGDVKPTKAKGAKAKGVEAEDADGGAEEASAETETADA